MHPRRADRSKRIPAASCAEPGANIQYRKMRYHEPQEDRTEEGTGPRAQEEEEEPEAPGKGSERENQIRAARAAAKHSSPTPVSSTPSGRAGDDFHSSQLPAPGMEVRRPPSGASSPGHPIRMNYPAASYGVSKTPIRNGPFAASCGELTRMRLKIRHAFEESTEKSEAKMIGSVGKVLTRSYR
jgi:hypothetical protein